MGRVLSWVALYRGLQRSPAQPEHLAELCMGLLLLLHMHDSP